MKKMWYLLLGLILFGGSSSLFAADYVPGELLIKFKGSAPTLLAAPVANNGVRTRALRSVRAIMLNRAPTLKIEQWKLPAGLTTEAAIQQLQKNPNVEFVEPNYRRFIRALPNDPSFFQQWGLQNTGQTINTVTGTAGSDMGLVTAWNTQTGSKNVIVAVIDDSIDINHPDLSANIWTNTGEIPGDGIDNDGNGFIDDLHGWDFKGNDNDPSADPGAGEGHGTAVAGSIGAVANNATGVAGVNWAVSIMPLKFGMDTASEILAIDYAITKGAHIINASFGAPGAGSQAERDAVTRMQTAGILFVVAAGNDNGNNDWVPDAPSGYLNPNVLAVGASTSVDNMTTWSHYGATTVDVVAPGESIYTTQSVNGAIGSSGVAGVLYDFIDGTSFSSPYVAGIAALIKAQIPTAGFQELKGRIMASATQLVSLRGLVSSGGRVDAATALTIPVQPTLVIGDVSWNDGAGGNGMMTPGETGNLIVQIDNVWANATGVSATMTALSGNLTVNTPTVVYPDIVSGGKQNGTFNATVSGAIGHQVYKFRLDISAAGGYAVTRYYEVQQAALSSGTLYNSTLGVNDQDDYQFFMIDIPAGSTNLSVNTTSGQNINLMVTNNGVPVFNYGTYVTDPVPANTQKAVTASGNESINIINPTAGLYTVTVLKPSIGNNVPFTIKAILTTPDTVAPVITVVGGNPLTIAVGSTYTDAGATALDAVDGAVTPVTTGTVNTAVAGQYTLTYTATDAAGNVSTATRTVKVLPVGVTVGSSTVTALALSGTATTVTISSTNELLFNYSSAAMPGTPPAGVSFPLGVISYSTTVPAGASKTITLNFSTVLPVNLVVYKINGTAYTLIPRGAGADQWTQTGPQTISITLTDGGVFDLDGVADGIIVDPIAVGSTIPATVTTTATSSGGCAIARHSTFDPTLIGLFLLSLLWSVGRKKNGVNIHVET